MDQKRIKRLSDAQERRTAKELGAGRTRPGSGNKDHAKGDVITGRAGVGFNTEDFLIENKFTFESKYTLKLSIWDKISNEALRENMRTPIMQIDIAKNTLAEVRIIVMDKNDFIGLDLMQHFPNIHKTESSEAGSFRIDALAFKKAAETTSKYREQYIMKRARKMFVILSLEDFKQCIAIC